MNVHSFTGATRKVSATVTMSALLVGLLAFGVVGQVQAVSLSLLHCWGGVRAPWVEEMVDAFVAEHPGVDVTIQVTGCGAEVHEAFLTAFVGGAPPDVVMVHSLYLPGFVLQNALVPLDGFIQEKNISQDLWYPPEIESARWDGKTYGFPIRTGGDGNSLMFYNIDAFERVGLDAAAPPSTWSELADVSRSLIRYEGDTLVQAAFTPWGGEYDYLAWLTAGGARLLSDDGRSVQLADTKAVEAANFIFDHFASRYRGGLDEVRNLTGTSIQERNIAFTSGALAIDMEGSWRIANIDSVDPDLRYGIALRPTREANGQPGIHTGTFHYALSDTPRDIETERAALELLAWLTLRDDTAGHFVFRQGRPSPVREFNHKPEYLEINPYWHVVSEALSRVADLPLFPYTIDLVTQIPWVAVIEGHVAAQSAFEDAARLMQRSVDEYWNR